MGTTSKGGRAAQTAKQPQNLPDRRDGSGRRQAAPEPRRASTHRHSELDPAGEEFAKQMTIVAVQTIHTALLGTKQQLRDLELAGKRTAEFERLRKSRVPEEAKAWVDKAFRGYGPVFQALRSEIAIALGHAQATARDVGEKKYECAPAHLRPGSDNGKTDNPQGSTSCCYPWCQPP